MTMKALSVRQPWAAKLIAGSKSVEWRSWPTTYRGTLAIHASNKVSGRVCHRGAESVRGAIIGTVELVDVQRRGTRWAWIVDSPRRLAEPVPMTGRLGLFDVSEGEVARG